MTVTIWTAVFTLPSILGGKSRSVLVTYSKVNTAVQIVTVILILVQQVWMWLPFQIPIDLLLRAISIIAPCSAVQYAWVVARRVQERAAANGAAS